MLARQTCATCGERYRVRFDTDGKGRVVEIADPCACTRVVSRIPLPRTKPEAMPYIGTAEIEASPVADAAPPITVVKNGTTAPAKGPSSEDIRRVLRDVLKEASETRFTDAMRAVEQRYGVKLNPGTFHSHWKRVRAELGLGDPSPAAQSKEPRRPGPKPKAKPVPAAPESAPQPEAATVRPMPDPVRFGEAEQTVLRFVGVPDQVIEKAVLLAEFINGRERSRV